MDIDPEARSLVGSLQMTADVTAPLHDLVLHLDQELQVDEVLWTASRVPSVMRAD